MSAIRFVDNASSMCEFRLIQGTNQIARIGVPSGGDATVPTTTQYTVQAFTSMGQFSLSSNPVTFDDPSITLLAQVKIMNGYYNFDLVTSPGMAPFTITLENTWSSAVQFKLSQPNSPVAFATVVDEHNNTPISTAQVWTCYAICNGITTATVTLTDPNATVTATDDNNDSGVTLTVT
jgi:hypothetical protein